MSWELAPGFQDPFPHVFQLQVGRTGLSTADDWEPVGLTVENTFFAIDDSKRLYGKTNWTHYRICLQTPVATYFSQPVNAWGNLSQRDWRLAREIKRQELLRLRKFAGQQGFLLKRRLYGPPCTECIDFQTGEVRNSNCVECLGTGFLRGYFDPISCFFVDMELIKRHEERDGMKMRGTINDIVVPARLCAEPQVNENDVWVDEDTDHRWYFHTIQHLAEIKGVPLVVKAELRLAPFTDVIYKLNIAR